jgi:UDP-2-acetamido-3-amino-2,3-dideoxy-glucuronate N-acetyltransferase
MLSYEDSSQERNILFYEKGIDWIQGEPITHDGATDIIPYDRTLPLDEELNYFAAHLDGSPVELANGQNGVEVLEILEAATESLLEKEESESRPGTENKERDWFAHDSACIDKETTIGNGTKIWHFSHILSGTTIGERCNIGQNVVIGPDVTVGQGCKIQNNVCVYKGVTLEDDVFCGPSMVFTNVFNPRAEVRRMDEIRETLVKKGATIGANATIVCGTTIGSYAFIGAGAVITADVPDYALMVGNPARQKGWMCRCGEKLTESLTCTACGRRYEEKGAGLAFCHPA